MLDTGTPEMLSLLRGPYLFSWTPLLFYPPQVLSDFTATRIVRYKHGFPASILQDSVVNFTFQVKECRSYGRRIVACSSGYQNTLSFTIVAEK